MADIREKIKKLMALADSPNEGEAKAALLKARQLMAEHKLTEIDLETLKSENVITIGTDISFTSLSNAWAGELSAVIAEHYCCRAFSSRIAGKKTSFIGFVGIEDDVQVCERIFRYACDYIKAEGKRISAHYKKYWNAREVREAREAYGFGFTIGVGSTFQVQDETHQEWGLVLKTPKAVLDEVERQHWRRQQAPEDRTRDRSWTMRFRAAGYNDGKDFDPSTKLEG